MQFTCDIKEDDLLSLGNDILDILLRDRTTGGYIIWATENYAKKYGEGYGFYDEITPEKITGKNESIIKPRVMKPAEEQKQRSQDKAEVFTPSWICNAQNNLVDEAWFGMKDVFNHEVNDGNIHSWITFHSAVDFPKGKDWHKYIADNRLEMACGEAPYMFSRYDATTGRRIPIDYRIGLGDRKFKVLKQNTANPNDFKGEQRHNRVKIWRRGAYRVMQSLYGFEFQGDNLLLARESAFVSYIEYYQDKFNTDKLPDYKVLKNIANIISWNFWQMDGLTLGIPGHEPKEAISLQGVLFAKEPLPHEKYCRVMEWTGYEPIKGEENIFKKLTENI